MQGLLRCCGVLAMMIFTSAVAMTVWTYRQNEYTELREQAEHLNNTLAYTATVSAPTPPYWPVMDRLSPEALSRIGINAIEFIGDHDETIRLVGTPLRFPQRRASLEQVRTLKKPLSLLTSLTAEQHFLVSLIPIQRPNAESFTVIIATDVSPLVAQIEAATLKLALACGGGLALIYGLWMITLWHGHRHFKNTYATLTQERAAADSANKTKTLFLATMSHEIRTPLNGVVAAAELLDDTDLTPDQRRLTGIIRTSSDVLYHTICDVLDFSRIEAGQFALDHTSLSLTDLVESVTDMMSMRATEKGLTLGCSIDPIAHDHLYGDGVRIKQILINLVNNAIKFTEHGHIVIRASALLQDKDQSLVLFEVQDTGIGIPKDRQAAIFEPFVQAEDSTQARYGGTGLGLSICRAIVTAMKGSMGVDSAPESGSRFWFQVPLRPMPERRRPEPDLGAARIMVRVKEPFYADIICRYLRARGAEAVSVTAPIGESLKQGSWRLVVSDQEKPTDMTTTPPWLRLKTQRPLHPNSDDIADIETLHPLHRRDFLLTVARTLGIAVPVDAPQQGRRAADPVTELPACRILLAEDHPTNQTVMRILIGQMGHTIDVANNGQEAWEKFLSAPYDLLITDCHMPIMTGLELSQKIRDHEKGTGYHLPIIALTADARADSAMECRAAGIDTWLSKPVTRTVLRQAIETGVLKIAILPQRAPAPPPPTNAPILDTDFLLKEVLDGHKELLVPLLTEFVEATKNDIATIQSAYHLGNLDEVRRCAHSACGAARMAGASQLADLCKKLENTIKDGTFIENEALPTAIQASFDDIIRSIKILSEKIPHL